MSDESGAFSGWLVRNLTPELSPWHYFPNKPTWPYEGEEWEAVKASDPAGQIARLQTENAALREALGRIAHLG